MYKKNKIVFTDKVCISLINKKYKIKETIQIKKVGPPTLVKNNKKIIILKEEIKSKKVGPSTLVNFNPNYVKKILQLLSIFASITSVIAKPVPTYYSLPAYTLCPTAWPPHTCQPHTAYSHYSGTKWGYSGISSNKLVKMVNGNRRLGYNLGNMWNCRRGRD